MTQQASSVAPEEGEMRLQARGSDCASTLAALGPDQQGFPRTPPPGSPGLGKGRVALLPLTRGFHDEENQASTRTFSPGQRSCAHRLTVLWASAQHPPPPPQRKLLRTTMLQFSWAAADLWVQGLVFKAPDNDSGTV